MNYEHAEEKILPSCVIFTLKYLVDPKSCLNFAV